MDRKIAVRVLRDRDRKAREKVLRVLDGIEPSGGESSYARAMVCRSLAQNMMMSSDFGPALVWSEKAADYARRPDPASSGEAYECPRSRVPVAVDGDDRDWDDVAWTGLGESRFKTKSDERNLCFLAELKDDEIINTALPPRLWSGDGLEIYLNVLNLEGRRALADLDFQYCFSSSGLAQVMRGSDTTSSSSLVAVKPVDGGYRLEIAVPHRETMLAPVDGYELGFNLRHIGWGMKTIAPGKTGLRTDKEEILRDTGMAPYTNTFGWPKLRLTGGRRSLKPGAKYSQAEHTITVRGMGCTLEEIARVLNDPSVMRIDQEGALVNADIAVGDFSDLALTMNIRSRRKVTPMRMRAGTGSRIEARGDCDLLNVELSADAEAQKRDAEHLNEQTV